VKLIKAALFFIAMSALSAQTTEEALKGLIDKALAINVSSRLLQSNENEAWKVDTSRLTIPGRAIQINLEGDNVRVSIEFTPYKGNDTDLVLLAKAEIWISHNGKEQVEYQSSFHTILMNYKEGILFFPLGRKNEDIHDTGENELVITVEIEPYLWTLKG